MTVASRQNPIVARFRAAARGEADSIILLDGAHLVADALAAGTVLHEAAVTASAEEDDELATLLRSLEAAQVNVTVVTTAVMDALSPVRSSSAIVALADRPDADPSAIYTWRPALVVIAVDIQDPGNVGAIVRVAEAGGASGVVAAGACADPFGWKALRGSMGSALRLPVATVRDAREAITAARSAGCRTVAAIPRGGRPMTDVDLRQDVAILIGGEGPGLPAAVIDAADERVTIPMEDAVESLNSAVAAALCVYEARRQRARS